MVVGEADSVKLRKYNLMFESSRHFGYARINLQNFCN